LIFDHLSEFYLHIEQSWVMREFICDRDLLRKTSPVNVISSPAAVPSVA
jgi:hypothetical protein